MWSPDYLKARNLFSFAEYEYNFITKQTTLVCGNNKTDDGVKSNGSGKTSQLDMFSIAITGDPIRDVNKEDIIRNYEDEGYVEISLTNPVLKSTMIIKQDLHIKKSKKVTLTINGEVRDDLKDLKPDLTFKEVLRLLDLTKEDLFNYFLINKEKYESFFLSNDRTKKEVVNRFSKADIIDPIEPIIKEDIAELENSIKDLSIRKSTLEGRIAFKKDMLQKEREIDHKKQNKEEITQYEISIEDTQKSINERKKTIKSSEALLKNKNKELNDFKIDKTKLEKLEKEKEAIQASIKSNSDKIVIEEEKTEALIKKNNISKQTLDKELTKLQEDKKETNSFILDVEANLEDSIECPKCKHKFLLRDKEYNLEEAKASLKEMKELLEELIVSISDKEKEITTNKQQKEKLSKDLEVRTQKLNDEKKKLKNDLQAKDQEIEDEEEAINKLEEKKEALEEVIETISKSISKEVRLITESQDLIEDYQKQINLIKKRKVETKEQQYIDAIYKEESILGTKSLRIQFQQDLLQDISLWQNYFKKFKSYLANNSISAIESQTNHFLQKMKTNLSVMIDGFRELSNGKLKEEISIQISRDGLDGENFSKFSGGEKSKCDIACILAMQELINMNANGGGLDFLFIDEILESNDDVALSGIIQGLSSVGRTILLITHVDSDRDFGCNKIVVEKVNKISRLVA